MPQPKSARRRAPARVDGLALRHHRPLTWSEVLLDLSHSAMQSQAQHRRLLQLCAAAAIIILAGVVAIALLFPPHLIAAAAAAFSWRRAGTTRSPRRR